MGLMEPLQVILIFITKVSEFIITGIALAHR